MDLQCYLLGRGKERADVNVEAEVRKRRGDHVRAAVVPVLQHSVFLVD